jgi:hypothetical protein
MAPTFWRFGSFEIFSVGGNGVEGPFVGMATFIDCLVLFRPNSAHWILIPALCLAHTGEVDRCRLMLEYFIKEHYSHLHSLELTPTERCEACLVSCAIECRATQLPCIGFSAASEYSNLT